jgi:polar amino acid transport system substrate-binding protein
LGLAACSSSSQKPESSPVTPQATVATSGVIPAAAALVPAAMRSKGTLDVAMEAEYKPFEYLDTDNTTIIGFDPDIAKALGSALDLKIRLVNTGFETIIPGLQSGKYDLGVSAFNVTSAREQVVDLVTYFAEGDVILAKPGNPDNLSINNLCGKTLGIGEGSAVESVIVPNLTKACQSAGRATIQGKVFGGQDATDLAVVSGQVQGTIIDQAAGTAIADGSDGKIVVVGEAFDKVPAGIVVPKTSAMTPAIHLAMQGLIDNGVYKTILAKWSLQGIGIATSQVNVTVP